MMKMLLVALILLPGCGKAPIEEPADTDWVEVNVVNVGMVTSVDRTSGNTHVELERMSIVLDRTPPIPFGVNAIVKTETRECHHRPGQRHDTKIKQLCFGDDCWPLW